MKRRTCTYSRTDTLVHIKVIRNPVTLLLMECSATSRFLFSMEQKQTGRGIDAYVKDGSKYLGQAIVFGVVARIRKHAPVIEIMMCILTICVEQMNVLPTLRETTNNILRQQMDPRKSRIRSMISICALHRGTSVPLFSGNDALRMNGP